MDSSLVMHNRYNSFTFDSSDYKGLVHLKGAVIIFNIKMFVLQLSYCMNIAKCVRSTM